MGSAGIGARTWTGSGFAAGCEGRVIASGPGRAADQRASDWAADGFLRCPLGLDDGILITLSGATQRQWWPYLLLPGAAWIHETGDRTWVMLGFPVSAMSWQVDERLRITAEAGDNWHGGIDLRLDTTWTANLAWDWRQDAYRRSNTRAADLLVCEDQRLSAGISATPAAWLECDVSLGWAYQRDVRLRNAANARTLTTLQGDPTWVFAVAAYVAL